MRRGFLREVALEGCEGREKVCEGRQEGEVRRRAAVNERFGVG